MPYPLTLPFAFLIVLRVVDFWLLIYSTAPSPALKNAHNESGLLYLLTLGYKKRSSTSQQCTLFFDLEQSVCEFNFAVSSSSVSGNLKPLKPLSSPLQGLFLLCVLRTAYHAGKDKHLFTRKGIIHLNINSLTQIDFCFRR